MDLVCRNLSFDFVLFRIRPLKLLEFACLRHMTTHILHGCIDGYLILYMYNVDCVYAYICASLKFMATVVVISVLPASRLIINFMLAFMSMFF